MRGTPELEQLSFAVARVKDRLVDLERAIQDFDGAEENEVVVRLAAAFVENAAKAVKRLVTSNKNSSTPMSHNTEG